MSKYKIGDKVQPVSYTAQYDAGGSDYGTVVANRALYNTVRVEWEKSPGATSRYWSYEVQPYAYKEGT